METIKCTYSNGDTITTKINGTIEEIKEYYIGNMFNVGDVSDNMQQCIKVELVNEIYNP